MRSVSIAARVQSAIAHIPVSYQAVSVTV